MASAESVARDIVEERKHVEDHVLIELRDPSVVGVADFRMQPEPQFANVELPDVQPLANALGTGVERDSL